jgi:hypothetical protein
MLLQGNVEKCFLLTLSSENKKRKVHRSSNRVQRSSDSCAQVSCMAGPAGFKSRLAPRKTLFSERQQWVFLRISAIILGVFSKYHKFDEGVSEALMGGVGGMQRPILRVKEPDRENTNARTHGQNPLVKKTKE